MNELTIKSDISQALLQAEDTAELEKVINIANAQLMKQKILRNYKISNLQDKIIDEVSARIDDNPLDISTKDLMSAYKTFDASLETKSQEVPQIQINQQVNHNSGSEFTRDSRARILSAVDDIISQLSDSEIVEVEEFNTL